MKIIVYHVDSQYMSRFYFGGPSPAAMARELLANAQYVPVGTFDVEQMDAEAGCEEAYDRSNNPSRMADRMDTFGRVRSLSVGDVVVVEGEAFVCAPFGWERL